MPARQVSVELYDGKVSVAPDGSAYFPDGNNYGTWRVRRIDPDGLIWTVAGATAPGFSGDGGPATEAQLNNPKDVAFGPDGSLYIADSGNQRVRRVDPDGIITTVAGNGDLLYNGDDIPAVDASLSTPVALAIGPDSSLYIATLGSGSGTAGLRVRRVGPSGIITTVAGKGWYHHNIEHSTNDVDATTTPLRPADIAVDAQGVLYIACTEGGHIRRVGF